MAISAKFTPVLGLFKKIWFLWLLCLIVNSIAFWLVKFKIHAGNKTLALHYNVIAGVEWYGKGTNLYYIPFAGLILCIVNFILYRAFEHIKSFLPLLVVLVTFCIELTVLCALLFLLRVN